MNPEKQRYDKLTALWKESGIGEIKDEQLDFFMNELKRFQGWNRIDQIQRGQVTGILKKFNDRLGALLKKRGLL